jgi:tetratricopeptide (TPR) repeat protein
VTIERLGGVLSAIGAPATKRELAEMLWLACHITPPEAGGRSRRPGERGAADALSSPGADPAGPREAGRDAAQARQAADDGDARTGLFPKAARGPVLNAGQVLVPAAPMIGNALAIERALRPLKRTVSSDRDSELDEDATATRIAGQPRDAREWIPVLRQAPERWLSLALVVDTGPSMQVWQPMAEELREILTRLGAFRELRTWYLRDGDIAATPDGLPQRPAGLLSPTRRQAVLVLSDCSGPHWWSRRAQRALSLWGEHAATAILQPLSERLWRRTALPPVPGIAYLKAAGAPNSELVFSPHEAAADVGIPVPVVEISPDWLADWVRLLLGPSGDPVPAAASYVTPASLSVATPQQREQQLSIAERVRRFQESASPEAAWLACCLAVSVPTLPVLRLIQHQMLGGRRGEPAHLAEVLLSGLLRPRDERRQAFEFVPGAREELIASMPRSRSWYVADVLSRISAEIEARAGRARDAFPAFQRVPDGTGGKTLRGDQPFALVSPEAVQYLRRTAAPVRSPRAPRAPRPDDGPFDEQGPGEQPQPTVEDLADQESTTVVSGPARIRVDEIYLSHTPEDRTWADWIAAVLAQRGILVTRTPDGDLSDDDRTSTETEQAAAAPRVIAVLSAAYQRSPYSRAVWEALASVDPARTVPRLIPVLVDSARFQHPWSERVVVDLTRCDAAQATERLLRVLGDPPKTADHVASPEPPYPRRIPPIWRVPARNASFIERDEELERLHDRLNSNRVTPVVPVALYSVDSGEATEIAVEYAHRFMTDYDIVWWVRSEQARLIAPQLAELAQRMGMRVDSADETALAVREALRLGRPYDRWLMVFDNAGEPDDIRDFLPGGPGHVIVISRNPAWSRVAEPVEIDVYSREESVRYLRRRVPRLTEADASLLAAELGDLPLAIELAGAWLTETGMVPADYVAELREQLAASTAHGFPTSYASTVAAACRLSFSRVQYTNPAAARLLELCAWFGPDPIALTLLYDDGAFSLLAPLDDRLRDRSMLGRLITDITRFSLAVIDRGKSLQVHRLVQAVIRDQMTHNDRDDTMHGVHLILAGARPRQGGIDDPANWTRYDDIWPHLGPSGMHDCDEEQPRELLIDRVRYLWKRGDYAWALDEAREIEQAWAERLGPEHQQTLFLRFQMANVLRSTGRVREAYELDTDTFEKQQRSLGDDHPDTLQTAGSIAADLRALGRFDQALARDEETYRQLLDLLGPDEPITLSSANNVAVDLRLVGDFARARDIDAEILADRRRVLGEDHPYTLHSAAMLGRDLRELGLYADSVDLLTDTLDRYHTVLGENFVDSLRTGKSLAVSLRKVGHVTEAFQFTSQTYERYEASYGASHPDALACRVNLACDQSALDDKLAAYETASQVLQAYEATLGTSHPFTLAIRNNISTYLRGTGSVREALELVDPALAGLRDELGDDHPFALSCSINRANCLHDLGRFTDAVAQLRDALERLSKLLGARHPDTLICQANLAVNLRASGRTEEAEQMQQLVITRMREVLGEEHPNIISLRDWRLQNRDLEVPPT